MPDERLLARLTRVYGAEEGARVLARLEERLSREPARPPLPPLDRRDAVLITYGDQFQQAGAPPLSSLDDFARRRLDGLVSAVHILPFYPSTSDDGFSVVDYHAVDPALGGWDAIARLGERFDLMFDAVINHASVSSAWFQAYLRREPPYERFFIDLPPETDLSRVIRPRALPLLTRFETAAGPRWVWTTFSADQVDLNYREPEVLLAVVDVLLDYVRRGARFIRLDAIAFLWKTPGTACLHLPETHALVQLFRALLERVAPGMRLITETNVPHRDNLSYFGDGHNEAHLVYNFALPPLVMDAIASGSAVALSEWAAGLRLPSDEVTFFNFLASHDGIGLNPARGILPDAAIDALVARALAHGGRVSYKHNPDGSQSPYELNISYFDALSDPHGGEPLDLQVDRFIATQAVLLALQGVPGIYVHSLLGSRSWQAGVAQTGRARSINREKFDLDGLEAELDTPSSLRAQVFSRFARLLRARRANPAFDPSSPQTVLDVGEAVFALLRGTGDEQVACLHNLSAQAQPARVDADRYGLARDGWRDLLSGARVELGGLRLRPYQVMWLGR